MTDAKGDCFRVAATLLLDGDGTDVLVHGIVTGDDGPIVGVEHWHAWIERTKVIEWPGIGRVELVNVIDRSNGKDVTMSPGLYYKLGEIAKTWRYSAREAMNLMHDTGHYGPWVDPKEDKWPK